MPDARQRSLKREEMKGFYAVSKKSEAYVMISSELGSLGGDLGPLQNFTKTVTGLTKCTFNLYSTPGIT